MKMVWNLILLGLSSLYSVEAAKGVDVSRLLYDFDFKDFVEGGYDGFLILQGYRSNGSVNFKAINDSHEEASAAGYDNFDIYMSPCPRCNKSASQQVNEMGKSLIRTALIVPAACIWMRSAI